MKARICVLPGDGIGPEVTAEATRVLTKVGERYGHTFELREALMGGIAIDKTGAALPDETLAIAKECDAVLLGAVGGPKWDDPKAKVRPEQGLLGIRKGLGLFANIRPVKLYPTLIDASPLKRELLEGVDMVVIRELTGGIYFGEKKREADRASDLCVYTVEEIRRIARVGCETARGRRKKLTSVDKANVLETSQLWRSAVTDVARAYPDVRLEHMYVDACAMRLAVEPRRFDVILTENLFGDILSDQAAALAGSIGMLPSATIGGRVDLYEPVHGSAPDIAGTNRANPFGAIASAAMLLRQTAHLTREADLIDRAIRGVLDMGFRPADVAAGRRVASTTEIGDAVVAALAELIDYQHAYHAV
jgi:3-isopropylmalate dehydrogenase